MKRILLPFFTILIIYACQNDTEAPPPTATLITAETFSPPADLEQTFGTWQVYVNRTYNFSLEYPEQWWIAENKGNSGRPVINIYSAAFDNNFELPLTIHEDPKVSHVSFFPEGPDPIRPSGTAVNLAEIDPPITFDPDSSESAAYQLNDGEIWGYFLKPDVLPAGWQEDGYIFIQISVQDLEVKCFDASGKQKSVVTCNPDEGDRIIKYGTVDKTDRNLINHILNTLYFTDTQENRRPIAELIRINGLSANDTIQSPAIIRGSARGIWYNEGTFPVVLKDKDHNVLMQTSATATGEWMTSGLVPFQSTVQFKAAQSGQAYLLFMKANPSGNSENDRGYILPVILK